MAEGTERNRDHLRAGIFVVVCLGLAIGTFLTLQRFNWTAKSEYAIEFAVDNGVTGLSPGSEVRVGGLRRGSVLAIHTDANEGYLKRILVHIELEASIILRRDAQALRVVPLLGNNAWINFTNVGSTTEPQVPPGYDPDHPLKAVEAPGLLANIAGSRSAADIVTIISRAEKFSEILARAPGDYEEYVVPALDSTCSTIGHLRDDYQVWRDKVGRALDSAEAAAKNLEEGTRDAKTLVADARATLEENRQTLKNAIVELESATTKANEIAETVRTQTVPQIAQLLGRGQTALGELADFVDRVDREVATELPDVRTTLDDIRVAAGQLKLATIEVRRSPWRLFYRPSVDVLAHEQLYEATRAFAMASADLRTAAGSFEELLRVRPEFLDDDELQSRLKSTLIDALGRYEEAQRRLHGVLLDEK